MLQICSLCSLNIHQIKVHNISNITGIFAECSNLISILNISNWFITISKSILNQNFQSTHIDKNEYISNGVFYFRYMFYNCKSLKILPDISKWDTKYVNDMSYFFLWM